MTAPASVTLMLDVLGMLVTAVCIAARIRHRQPVGVGFLVLGDRKSVV